MFPKVIEDLAREFSQFKGVGPKTAQKFVFHLLKKTFEERKSFSQKLENLEKIKICPFCGNFTEEEICFFCKDKTRDHSLVCVVQTPLEIEIIEKTGSYKGIYEVLGGLLDDSLEIRPESLKIGHFLKRLEQGKGKIKEVIFALSSNLEGEATLLYLLDLIKKEKDKFQGIKFSKLARGLSSGMELEYTDPLTLEEALKERKVLL